MRQHVGQGNKQHDVKDSYLWQWLQGTFSLGLPHWHHSQNSLLLLGAEKSRLFSSRVDGTDIT